MIAPEIIEEEILGEIANASVKITGLYQSIHYAPELLQILVALVAKVRALEATT